MQEAIAQIVGKLGYQSIGTSMQSMFHNWAKKDGVFSKIILGVGPINLTLGNGKKLLQIDDNIENLIGVVLCSGNTIFGGRIGWDWDNLTLTSKGGLADFLFPPREYSSGFTLNAILGNGRVRELYAHELHHLWQERAMPKFFYYSNYIFNGLSSFIHKGDFFKRYNLYEDIPNNSIFWPTDLP